MAKSEIFLQNGEVAHLFFFIEPPHPKTFFGRDPPPSYTNKLSKKHVKIFFGAALRAARKEGF